jgi:uncharacterized protein YjiS (DUF1127 family)
MSRTFDLETDSAFAERPTFSFAALLRGTIETMRIWRKRWGDRRELLDCLAVDDRLGADIGVNRSDLREWAERPFWRA